MFEKLGGLRLSGTNFVMFALTVTGLVFPLSEFNNAYADPPPWAAAHGYRDQQYREGDGEREGDRGYREDRRREHDDEGDDEDEHRSRRDEVVDAPYIPPYGIDRGTCDRERIGQILGGIAGAAIGSNVGRGDSNAAAIIGGAIIGVIVGGNIGRSMDRVDQGCVGQILEHDPDGMRVAWVAGDGRTRYQVVPETPYKDRSGRYCRKYSTNAVSDGADHRTINTACRESDGSWKKIR